MEFRYHYFGNRAQFLEVEHRRRIIYQVDIRRQLRDTCNPFSISVSEFRKLYRLPQHLVMKFINDIYPYFRVRQNANHVPLELKILCALAFFANGSYQRPTGKSGDLSLSQSSVCNIIAEVTEVLNHPDIISRYIHFPTSHQEREDIMERNTHLGLPRVLGFVDGSYVKIFTPSKAEQGQAYYCRKGYTAINTQVVCDADLNILAVDASFPGSCNDPYIYKNSGLSRVMAVAYNESQCWLLGDSIYPLQPWLHTPIPHAARGTPEFQYTKVHCHARNAVERCFGVLQARWRCLIRELHYNPTKAGKIINACCVLHNFCQRHRLQEPHRLRIQHDENRGDIFEYVLDEPFALDANQRRLAQQERQFLINYANGRGNHE